MMNKTSAMSDCDGLTNRLLNFPSADRFEGILILPSCGKHGRTAVRGLDAATGSLIGKLQSLGGPLLFSPPPPLVLAARAVPA